MLQECLSLIIILLVSTSCQSQTPKYKNMSENNPLICNPETGFCELPNSDASIAASGDTTKMDNTIRIIYFTDPICSSCWGIEGVLRKLKLEYKSSLTIEYRMGGLLPSFDNNYNAGGIRTPADVAHHWDQASHYYQMPIDGDVWLEDPLSSSYPPSIAFKVAELQDKVKAISFLRIMREMLFLQKRNISKWDVIAEAAKRAHLDLARLKNDYDKEGIKLLQADLELSREMRVRGFPTLYFYNEKGLQEVVYGAKPYAEYEKAIMKTDSRAKKENYPKDALSIVTKLGSISIKELAILAEIGMDKAEQELLALEKDGTLKTIASKNGNLWKLK
ncbi:MAG: hypothetical protein RL662_1964 [Bacteroidota bacterium]|jgi:predicted DsbA family dithiol-disulfide isomerase